MSEHSGQDHLEPLAFWKTSPFISIQVNHEMWITWKVIVRGTCFCEKIQTDYTLSCVFHKCFNFVPMLESRNVDQMKSYWSWDMFLWKHSSGLHAFMSFSKNISTLHPC